MPETMMSSLGVAVSSDGVDIWGQGVPSYNRYNMYMYMYILGILVVSEVPELYRKPREACRKNV